MINIPIIGIGTYKLNSDVTYNIVKKAIHLGYKHIDTAKLYKNEEAIGKAIKDSNIARSDIFITTKIWIDSIKRGRNAIIQSVKDSLNKLNCGYIDLLLIHAPVNKFIVDSWKTLEDIYLNKIEELVNTVKNIGVSNFEIDHLRVLLNDCRIVPIVNQIEISPFLKRDKLVKFCNEKRIKIIAHSSLTKGIKLNHPVLLLLGNKYNVSTVNILLKWSLMKGFYIIPRTSNIIHLEDNIKLDFILTRDDIKLLDDINEIYASHPKYLINEIII